MRMVHKIVVAAEYVVRYRQVCEHDFVARLDAPVQSVIVGFQVTPALVRCAERKNREQSLFSQEHMRITICSQVGTTHHQI